MTREERAYNYASKKSPSKFTVGEITKHYNDGYVDGYKDAIDKAVEWIHRFAYNSVVTDHIGEREKQAIIMTFKQAMEEQQ